MDNENPDYDPFAPTPLMEARKSQDQTQWSAQLPEPEPGPAHKIDLMVYDPLQPSMDRAHDTVVPPPSRREKTGLDDTIRAELTLKEQRSEELAQRHAEANRLWHEEKEGVQHAQEWEVQKLRARGATLDNEFDVAAAPKDRAPVDDSPAQGDSAPGDLSDSKTLRWQVGVWQEIGVNYDRDRALELHDQRWERREQYLGLNTAPEPAPPEGALEMQSPKERYQEARGQWQGQEDAIVEKFNAEREEVRAGYETLTDIQNESALEPLPEIADDFSNAALAPMDLNADEPSYESQQELSTLVHEPAPEPLPEPIDVSVNMGGPVAEDHGFTPVQDFSMASGDMSSDRGM